MVGLIVGAMLVQILAPVTVMLSALMISSGSMEKPMRMIGCQVRMTRMQDEANMELAAQKLICGKQTRSPQLSRCIPVIPLMIFNTDAWEMIVVTMARHGSRVCATRMVATFSPG